MKETKIATYLDSHPGGGLTPSRTRLLFAAWIDHGPGASEKAEYRVGPSQCGKFDVFWISSDFDDGESSNEAAWIPRHQMKGKALWLALLKGLFEAEKAQLDIDEPNFSEVDSSIKALLSAAEIRQAAKEVCGFRE